MWRVYLALCCTLVLALVLDAPGAARGSPRQDWKLFLKTLPGFPVLPVGAADN